MKEQKKKLIEERKKFVEKITKENDFDINDSFKRSKYYQSFHGLDFLKKVKKLNKERKNCALRFIETDTISAANEIYRGNNRPDSFRHISPLIGYKVALLDFASYKKPGGGFLNGSIAQEEDICSKSTLYPILKLFEPVYKRRKGNKGEYGDDLLYIPEVYFVKEQENFGDFHADVIVSAAPNAKILREHCDERYINRVLFNRIENIFKVAIDNRVKCLILGAYGTGVFDNDVTVVATAFKECCDMYHEYFVKIVFAIPDKKKLDVFKQVFCIHE